MKSKIPEFHEGPDAAERFREAMNRVLKVSKDELLKREAERKAQPRKLHKKRA